MDQIRPGNHAHLEVLSHLGLGVGRFSERRQRGDLASGRRGDQYVGACDQLDLGFQEHGSKLSEA